jgi:hypothetical protein
MKRICTLMAILVLSIPATFAGTVDEAFTDISTDDSSYTAIKYLYENGIVEGFDDNTVRPDQGINRAEILKILVEGMGITPDEEEYKDCFEDVADDWYAKYACFAKDQTWVEGYEGNLFKPEQEVSFAEAIKMILEVNQVIMEPVIEVPDAQYMTSEDWFYEYYAVAMGKNLIHADDYLTYHEGPNSAATRGNAFINLYRTLLVVQEIAPWFNEDLASEDESVVDAFKLAAWTEYDQLEPIVIADPTPDEDNTTTRVSGVSVGEVDGKVRIVWDAFTGETSFDSYGVSMKTGSDFEQSDYDNLAPNTVPTDPTYYEFENLADGTYYFMISLGSSDGQTTTWTGNSESTSYTVVTPEPVVVTGLAASLFGPTAITLDWDAYSGSNDFDNYAVYIKKDSTFTDEELNQTLNPIFVANGTTTYNFENLDNGTYYFTIELVTNGENGALDFAGHFSEIHSYVLDVQIVE